MTWTETGRSIFAFAVVLSLLSAAAVTLRSICRARIPHILSPTDWFLLVTLVRTWETTAATFKKKYADLYMQMFCIANTCCLGIRM